MEILDPSGESAGDSAAGEVRPLLITSVPVGEIASTTTVADAHFTLPDPDFIDAVPEFLDRRPGWAPVLHVEPAPVSTVEHRTVPRAALSADLDRPAATGGRPPLPYAPADPGPTASAAPTAHASPQPRRRPAAVPVLAGGLALLLAAAAGLLLGRPKDANSDSVAGPRTVLGMAGSATSSGLPDTTTAPTASRAADPAPTSAPEEVTSAPALEVAPTADTETRSPAAPTRAAPPQPTPAAPAPTSPGPAPPSSPAPMSPSSSTTVRSSSSTTSRSSSSTSTTPTRVVIVSKGPTWSGPGCTPPMCARVVVQLVGFTAPATCAFFSGFDRPYYQTLPPGFAGVTQVWFSVPGAMLTVQCDGVIGSIRWY